MQEDTRDVGSISGSGRYPGAGNGSPFYSCLENPMDRRVWWATVYGVAKSWTQLSKRLHLDRSQTGSSDWGFYRNAFKCHWIHMIPFSPRTWRAFRHGFWASQQTRGGWELSLPCRWEHGDSPFPPERLRSAGRSDTQRSWNPGWHFPWDVVSSKRWLLFFSFLSELNQSRINSWAYIS